MPEPMTAPTPSPIRLHGPSVLRNRRSGDSEAAISASIPRVRSSLFKTSYRLRTCWPLGSCLTFFLFEPRATVEARLAFGAAFLRAARCSFLRSSVDSIFFVFIVSFYRQTFVRPAYFSTSFFNPPRSKATTIFASAPSPSRRTMVPLPYLGCSTTVPVDAGRLGAGGATGIAARGLGGGTVCACRLIEGFSYGGLPAFLVCL